jgi:hypothetical protein
MIIKSKLTTAAACTLLVTITSPGFAQSTAPHMSAARELAWRSTIKSNRRDLLDRFIWITFSSLTIRRFPPPWSVEEQSAVSRPGCEAGAGGRIGVFELPRLKVILIGNRRVNGRH